MKIFPIAFLFFCNCCFGFIYDRHPFEYLPISAHHMIGKSTLNDVLEIEDGSVWKISPYDRYKIVYWHSNDTLVITQNTRWFTKYPYRIVNKITGASIEVNLTKGPTKNGSHTLYILKIDPLLGVIQLNNGTQWQICPDDIHETSQWLINHPIIIGENSDIFGDYESVLVNVVANKPIRVQQF